MKFVGKVGFWMKDVEVSPGIFKSSIVEKPYTGDVSRNTRRWRDGSTENAELIVNNTISILSDLFMQQHITSIKYVLWNDARLKVSNVTVDYPRIQLEIGGPYHGENAPNSP